MRSRQARLKRARAHPEFAAVALGALWAVFGNPRYPSAPGPRRGFVLERMRADGRLRRSFADGAAHEDAFLDDYAFLAAGLLDPLRGDLRLRKREMLGLPSPS